MDRVPPLEASSTAPTPGGRLDRGPRPALSPTERLAGVVGHHLAVYRKTWRGSVIERFLSPLFILLAMGFGLGHLVDSRAGGVEGTSYLHFVVPGILAMHAMLIAVGESTYPVMGLIRWNRMYAAMLATPLRVGDVLGGHLAVVAAHITFGCAVFAGMAALFGSFTSWLAVLTVPACLLTGFAFAAPVFALSASIENDDIYSVLFRFAVVPLSLFSGTYFPLDQLPTIIQPLAWITPLWHGVELCRAAALGTLAWGPAAGHTAVLAAYALLGWALARRAFTRRLAP